MKIHAVLLAMLLCVSSAHGQEDTTEKAQVALSYIDCDGGVLVRNGRLGVMLGGRFVADTILGATYVGTVYVWGGEDKRYELLFADDLSKVTMIATNGHGTIEAKCHRIQD
jgi:hypothetical protein